MRERCPAPIARCGCSLGRLARHRAGSRRHDDHRLWMTLSHSAVNVVPVEGPIGREGGDRTLDLIEQGPTWAPLSISGPVSSVARTATSRRPDGRAPRKSRRRLISWRWMSLDMCVPHQRNRKAASRVTSRPFLTSGYPSVRCAQEPPQTIALAGRPQAPPGACPCRITRPFERAPA